MLKKYVIIMDENQRVIIRGDYDQIQIQNNTIILFEEKGEKIEKTYIQLDFSKFYIQIV